MVRNRPCFSHQPDNGSARRRRFEVPLAANIALKKLREGAWTRPNRMPPNWLRTDVLRDARPESCVAA